MTESTKNETSEKDYVHVDGASGPQSVQRSVVEACSICGGRGRETLVLTRETRAELHLGATQGLTGFDKVFRCMSCGGAAQIPCDKCLQQGKVREYEEILIEW